jgi:hypothetical protein
MPNFLLYNKDVTTYAVGEACKLEDSMNKPRTEASNAQTRFKDFKDSVLDHAQKVAKTAVGASEKKRRKLVHQYEVLLRNKPPEPTAAEADKNATSTVVDKDQAGPCNLV